MAAVSENLDFEHSDATASADSCDSAVVLTPDVANFGVLLENMRLKHNFSRRDVSVKCRITPGLLEVLEAGDVSQIDLNRLMVGSIIEQLCNIYDELPDDVLEQFNRAYEEYHRNDDADAEKFNYRDAEINRSGRRVSATIIGVITILLLLALLAGWCYTTYQHNRQKEASANYDLPSLLPPPSLPMDVLKIPES